jgi:hypothetical protein
LSSNVGVGLVVRAYYMCLRLSYFLIISYFSPPDICIVRLPSVQYKPIILSD